MNRRRCILTLILFLAVPAAAREKTDVIVMSNGDRITGEIKGLTNGVLRIDLDYVDGTISVQWLKVARVESRQLFIVQAQDGSVYSGTLKTSPEEARRIEIGQTQGMALIEQARVVRLEETANSFIRRWNGAFNLGLVYSKGNNSIQNTFGSSLEYQRERWSTQIAYNSNLSSSSGSNAATRNQLDLGGYRLFPWKNYFYGGIGSFLQSSVQGIDLQSTLGGGVGRFFKNTNRARISVLAGAAWQNAKYDPTKISIAAQGSGAGLFATDLRFFVFKKTTFYFKAYLAPSFTEKGRTRFNTNATYYLKMFKNLSWNLSFYGNWDTQPPAHLQGSDYGYTVGIGWTFGYR